MYHFAAHKSYIQFNFKTFLRPRNCIKLKFLNFGQQPVLALQIYVLNSVELDQSPEACHSAVSANLKDQTSPDCGLPDQS